MDFTCRSRTMNTICSAGIRELGRSPPAERQKEKEDEDEENEGEEERRKM